MKSVSTFIIACLFSTVSIAQNIPTVVNGFGNGSTSWENAVSLDHDEAGNIYLTGCIGGTVDFDPSPGTFNLTTQGLRAAFVASYNTAGQLRWAFTIDGPGVEMGYGLTYDKMGSVYITGEYDGPSVDFDPGPDSSFLYANVNDWSNLFVMKVDTLGNLKWAKSAGVGGADRGSSVIVSRDGDVIVTGYFTGLNTDFDPGSGTALLSSQNTSAGADFLWRLDTAGNYLNAIVLGLGSNSNGNPFVSEDAYGNFYIVSSFATNCDLDPGPGTAIAATQGYNDVYVVKLDSNWNYVWSRTVGASLEQETYSAACDAEGNIYVGGYFRDTVDFDPGPGTYYLVSNTSTNCPAFVLALDPSGNFRWAQQYGGLNWVTNASAMCVDTAGKLYVGGNIWNSLDMDQCAGTQTLFCGGGSYFLNKMNPDGSLIWTISGTGIGSANCYAIDVDEARSDVIYSGDYQSNHDLGPGFSTFNVTGHGSQDLFWMRIHQCSTTTSVMAVSSCAPYTTPAGCTQSTSGTYYYTLDNAAGCDSIVEIQLTITSPSVITHVSSDTIWSDQPSVNYQWVDCNNGYSIIPGATQQFFVPTVSGNYAVILDNSICTDTSSCTNMIITSLRSETMQSHTIYPQPFTDQFTITNVSPNTQIVVRDMFGRLVNVRVNRMDNSVTLSSDEWSAGVYIVTLHTDNCTYCIRAVRN